jgi:tetratricopeptide (TPR) repeat protein
MADLPRSRALLLGWFLSAGLAAALRIWNSVFGPLFYGYDAWGHIAYVFFLDMYRAVPFADQGWSYFHPPLHYLFGWLLMQAGDATVLVVGLSLFGSAASLGVAVLGAWLVGRALPEHPGLPLLAFTAIAFLPVHVSTSPMPGNEMSAVLLGALAFAAHLHNEMREDPTRRGDLLTGILCGLAMLTKFTNLITILAIGALTALRFVRARERRAAISRLATRTALVAMPILLLAGPYYARNLVEFGTPFMTSAEVHDVHRIQASQPPGERSLGDFLRFSPAALEESVPTAPHMINSVWPNTYLNVWFDTFRESQLPFPRDVTPHPFIHKLTILFGLLGLVPSLIALYGAGISARKALREPANVIDAGLWILSLGTLAAFVLFAIRIPTWAALKASYLLGLSLPYAVFLARGSASLGRRDPGLGAVAPVMYGLIAAAVCFVFATGRPPGLMRRDFDSMQMHSIRAHFGDYRATRLAFRMDAPRRGYLEARAAAELFDGSPAVAIRFYERSGQMDSDDPSKRPWWLNRLAVANALGDRREIARDLLDEALALGAYEEMLVNRAVLAVLGGDLVVAERDLRRALTLAPDLPPAWTNLAVVLERTGRESEAADARARAVAASTRPPRGFPYGVGNGFLYESGAGQRFVLVVKEPPGSRAGAPRLSIYRPPRARN